MLFVHEDIIDAFITKFSDAVGRLKGGMPWDAGVQITPLPEPDKTKYLTELIDDARAKGARVVNKNGGTVHQTFMSPAVVYPVGPGMRLYSEEQFGPVVPIAAFRDIEEPMNYVIQSDYGQQVSLFGSDADVMAELIDPLVNQVCRVNINSQCQRGPDTFPFTGRKDSAEGTLSVSDALRVFTIRTLVAAKETEANRRIIKSIVTGKNPDFFPPTSYSEIGKPGRLQSLCTAKQAGTIPTSLRPVQNLAHLVGQGAHRERFLQEMDIRIENSVMGDNIIRVARHEYHPDLRSQDDDLVSQILAVHSRHDNVGNQVGGWGAYAAG